MIRIAFMGTPEFAVPSLAALYDAGYELCVFTQQDKPAGRGGRLTAPPVKVFASEKGPHSSDIQQYRNLNLLSIGYASRPRLRTRLTLGGRTSPRKP